jgi:hypothetical protein
MSEPKYQKLNQLEQDLPEGLLVDAAWLEQKGYYGSLRSKYLAAGWLEQPARGVYRRPRGELSWEQVVISLQSLMGFPVAVGGRTALELQGYAHYLSHTQQEVHLYGVPPVPSWLRKLPIETRFAFHNRQRLFPSFSEKLPPYALAGRTPVDTQAPLPGALRVLAWGQWQWPLVVSTPERAILELLDELPDRESFHQVDALVEGLATLSPRRLQNLLLECRSVKVKRLFFFFADRHSHGWFTKLDASAVDLGKGKRMVAKGGTFDAKYQITVPEDLHGLR